MTVGLLNPVRKVVNNHFEYFNPKMDFLFIYAYFCFSLFCLSKKIEDYKIGVCIKQCFNSLCFKLCINIPVKL